MKRRTHLAPKPDNPPKNERGRLEELLWIAEHGDVASLDLHGLSTLAAQHELEDFIHKHLYQHTQVVAIIHGHGTGALKAMTETWLKTHPTLITYSRPSLTARYAGVMLAVLAD